MKGANKQRRESIFEYFAEKRLRLKIYVTQFEGAAAYPLQKIWGTYSTTFNPELRFIACHVADFLEGIDAV